MMIGLHCMSESRIARLKLYITDYQKWCTVRGSSGESETRFISELYKLCDQKVSKRYDKNFDFFKQHAAWHVADDIEQRGATYNFTTRPGEGFQQEAAQAYKTTNRKKTEHQVSCWSHTILYEYLHDQ
jgi:hypothetical protein